MNQYDHIYSVFKKGDIAPLYEKMYPELLMYANSLLGSEYAFLSEDYVQDAIYKAYMRRNSFDSTLHWKVFMYTCIRNAIFSSFRKNNTRKKYLKQMDESDDTLLLNIIEQETITLLHTAISNLPDKYKLLFDLSFEKGLKNRLAPNQKSPQRLMPIGD